jgi:hypothetical protein
VEGEKTSREQTGSTGAGWNKDSKENGAMKKKMFVLALVALVALVSVAPALAAGPGPGPGKQLRCRRGTGNDCIPGIPLFTLVGILRGIGEGSLTVEVHHGNRFAQPYVGTELEVVTTEVTVYQRWTPTGCVPMEPEEIQEGDTTSMHGLVQEGIFTASRVTVGVPLDSYTQ